MMKMGYRDYDWMLYRQRHAWMKQCGKTPRECPGFSAPGEGREVLLVILATLLLLWIFL